MEDTLIQLLSSFGYPVMRQGSLAADAAYPDTFFTFWNRAEEGQSYYDNETASVVYDFDVNVYSTSPDRAYSLLAGARTLLKSHGYVTPTRGYDVPSDEITHVGRGMNVQYLQIDLSEPEPDPEPESESETEPVEDET